MKYQASIHGIDKEGVLFFDKCSGVERLLVIAQNEQGFIFGGFSTATIPEFSGSAARVYATDETAFLFSLRNPHNISPTILPVKYSNFAVTGFNIDSPAVMTYGHDDLCFYSFHNKVYIGYEGSAECFPSSYSDTTGKGNRLFTGSRNLGKIIELVVLSV